MFTLGLNKVIRCVKSQTLGKFVKIKNNKYMAIYLQLLVTKNFSLGSVLCKLTSFEFVRPISTVGLELVPANRSSLVSIFKRQKEHQILHYSIEVE